MEARKKDTVSTPESESFFGREGDLEFTRVTSTPASYIQHSWATHATPFESSPEGGQQRDGAWAQSKALEAAAWKGPPWCTPSHQILRMWPHLPHPQGSPMAYKWHILRGPQMSHRSESLGVSYQVTVLPHRVWNNLFQNTWQMELCPTQSELHPFPSRPLPWAHWTSADWTQDTGMLYLRGTETQSGRETQRSVHSLLTSVTQECLTPEKHQLDNSPWGSICSALTRYYR